jgi:hypothetical protein
MLILDKLRRRESKDQRLSLRRERVDVEHIDARKIIDFESAKRAFERDHSLRQNSGEFKRAFLSDLRPDRSAGVAEWLVTIVLALVIGLSLLLGMIWGF